jgi:hypothetical protein
MHVGMCVHTAAWKRAICVDERMLQIMMVGRKPGCLDKASLLLLSIQIIQIHYNGVGSWCTCTHAHTDIYKYAQAPTHTCTCTRTSTSIRVHTYSDANTHTIIQTNKQTHPHTLTHILRHTHTQHACKQTHLKACTATNPTPGQTTDAGHMC